jgi:hypothetical protein
MSEDLFGGTNGHGGRFMDTTEGILATQAEQRAAIEKAANPRDLTDEDLPKLPGDMLSDLMSNGQLTHLGFGRKHTGRRH